MSWLSNRRNAAHEATLTGIQRLEDKIERLRAQRDTAAQELTLQGQVNKLKSQIVELEIQRDKKQEDFDRRERELKHMIGLEQQRQKVETEQAKQGAVLEVKQQALTEQQARFTSQMEFQKKQFDKQVDSLENLMGQILQRLPVITMQVESKHELKQTRSGR
jgi:hypothetical protein